jgi:hypothetical protein
MIAKRISIAAQGQEMFASKSLGGQHREMKEFRF